MPPSYSIKKAMLQLDSNQIIQLLARAHLPLRLRRSLHIAFVQDFRSEDRDFLVIPAKNDNEGLILLPAEHAWYLLPYTLKRRVTNTATGRSKPITCDFCYTWQSGACGARISFKVDTKTTRAFLCCADLNCSLHVRDKTAASKLSRSQLRENLTPEARVTRLQQKLIWLVAELAPQKIDII